MRILPRVAFKATGEFQILLLFLASETFRVISSIGLWNGLLRRWRAWETFLVRFIERIIFWSISRLFWFTLFSIRKFWFLLTGLIHFIFAFIGENDLGSSLWGDFLKSSFLYFQHNGPCLSQKLFGALLSFLSFIIDIGVKTMVAFLEFGSGELKHLFTSNFVLVSLGLRALDVL